MEIKPFEKKVWLSSPTMHGEEQMYVNHAFEQNWITTAGENVNEVERITARYIGAEHAVAIAIVVRYFLKDKVDLSDLPLMKVEVGKVAFGSDKEREDAFLKAKRHQELLRQNFLADKDAEEEPRKAALSFLMMRFPEMFVATLTKMIMPNWYIASFCTDYKIPVVWSEYADGFKGVCLIFKTDESKASGRRGIRLFTSHSWSSEKGPIYEHHTETLHPVIYSQENVYYTRNVKRMAVLILRCTILIRILKIGRSKSMRHRTGSLSSHNARGNAIKPDE